MKRDTFLPLIGVVGLIALWYLAVWVRIVDPVLLPSPQASFNALVKGMGGKLGYDFFKTVERTFYATAIAAIIAIPLGIVLAPARSFIARSSSSSTSSARRLLRPCSRSSW